LLGKDREFELQNLGRLEKSWTKLWCVKLLAGNLKNMTTLENLGSEDRKFPPSAEFAAKANAQAEMYARAKADRLKFWEDAASQLHWEKKWDTVLDWQLPFAKWFVGGKINACYNAVDRNVIEGRGNRVAFYFEGEPGDTRTITY
jgi:acetyl-CoA synthetase